MILDEMRQCLKEAEEHPDVHHSQMRYNATLKLREILRDYEDRIMSGYTTGMDLGLLENRFENWKRKYQGIAEA